MPGFRNHVFVRIPIDNQAPTPHLAEQDAIEQVKRILWRVPTYRIETAVAEELATAKSVAA